MVTQTFDIPFSGGLNERFSEKILPHGLFDVLENVELDKAGTLRKRTGHAALSANIDGGGAIAAAKRIARFGEELLLADGDSLYSKGSVAANPWVKKGNLVTSRLTEKPMGSVMATDMYGTTMTYSAGYYTFVYFPSAGSLANDWYFSVVNATTGEVMQKDVAVDSGVVGSGSHLGVRVIPLSTFMVIIYQEQAATTNIKSRALDVTNPTSPGSPSNIITDAQPALADKNFDAVADSRGNDASYVAYWKASGGNDYLSITSFADTYNWDITAHGISNLGGRISMHQTSDNKMWIAFEDGTAVKIACVDVTNPASISLVFNPTTVETGLGAGNIHAITLAGTAASTVRVFYEIYGGVALANNTYIKKADVDTTPTVTGVAVFMRSVGIASRAWSRNNKPYLGVIHETATFASAPNVLVDQNTGFIVDSDANIVARFLRARANRVNDGSYPAWSDLAVPSSDVVEFCHYRNDGAWLEGSICAISFDRNKTGNFVYFADNLISPQGMLYNYDGLTVAEHGFHLYPHGIVTTGNPAGSLATNSAYQWRFTYEWYDEQGQRHESAPSPPHTVNTGANSGVSMTCPTLRLTGKTMNVFVVMYRTLANESNIFYRESTQNNNPAVDTLTFNSTAADSAVASQEKLYTAGGVLNNIVASPASFAVPFGDRLCLVGTDGRIHYSKYRTIQRGLPFNDGLFLAPDAGDGKVLGLASQDGQLIIATTKKILRTYGQGPDDRGIGSFPIPLAIASDVGIDDPSELYTFSGGTLAKSGKGLWLLDRSFGLQFIGESVLDTVSGDFTRGELHPINNDLWTRFSGITSGDCLILDLDRQLWKKLNTPNAQTIADVITVGDKLYIAFANGVVWESDNTTYLDGGTNYSMKFKTGDFRFAGINGFQRIHEIRILGEFKSQHTLNVKIHHADGTSESFTYAIAASSEPYQIRIQPGTQAVPAFALEVWETGWGGTREGAHIHALSIDAQMERMYPIDAGKTL